MRKRVGREIGLTNRGISGRTEIAGLPLEGIELLFT